MPAIDGSEHRYCENCGYASWQRQADKPCQAAPRYEESAEADNPTRVIEDEDDMQVLEVDYGTSVGWIVFLSADLADGEIDILPADAVSIERRMIDGVAFRYYWLGRPLTEVEGLYEPPMSVVSGEGHDG
ncbi:hypothetical protein [Streptomyces guryensis]|uniref:Uncharacterized protein n=1 Tax=Streptomyces guryensis TaxID=2886947 RepID=A0A9Q3Z8Z5_9ACTN|nr:hypothetical protein [Streptomyces guryensis]MCD9873810.1 hypothetical protein [Streptomyces guryensis]